jgi:uroporphyrinogen decarboxylase
LQRDLRRPFGEIEKASSLLAQSPVFGKVSPGLPHQPKRRNGLTLLGFCGAPWTVATYMIAGQGT